MSEKVKKVTLNTNCLICNKKSKLVMCNKCVKLRKERLKMSEIKKFLNTPTEKLVNDKVRELMSEIKPSERIHQLMKPYRRQEEWTNTIIVAILDYLNEQHANSVKNADNAIKIYTCKHGSSNHSPCPECTKPSPTSERKDAEKQAVCEHEWEYGLKVATCRKCKMIMDCKFVPWHKPSDNTANMALELEHIMWVNRSKAWSEIADEIIKAGYRRKE